MRRLVSAVVCSLVLGTGGVANAYPAAIIFAPTAESRPLGGVGGYAYGGSVVSPVPSSLAVAPWLGVQVGVLPERRIGKHLELGGAEIGADAFGPGDGTMKPVLNAKLSPIKQSGWIPGLGLGFMQFAPGALDRSLNLGYAVLTENIHVGRGEGTSLGTFTVGMAHSFASRGPRATSAMFHGTMPFTFGARDGLVLGYQSPKAGIFQLVGDHIGGYSEASVTNLAVMLSPADWAYAAIGYGLSNDRSSTYRADSAFVMLGFELKIPGLARSSGPSTTGKLRPSGLSF